MISYLIQQTVNGVQLGTVYALIALGYTMVYGIIRLINFAHADIFMIGAYIAFFIVAFFTGAAATLSYNVWMLIALICGYLLYGWLGNKVPALRKPLDYFDNQIKQADSMKSSFLFKFFKSLYNTVGIIIASAIIFPILFFITKTVFSVKLGPLYFPLIIVYVMAVCGFLGVAMEQIAYRPLRFKPRLSALITALGVSLFLENFCSLEIAFSNKYRAFPEIIKRVEVLKFEGLGVSISNLFFINIVTLAVLLVLLWFLVEKTLIGKQMRAVAFDKKASLLMGINVDRIIAMTFFIGPALAGVSGILYSMNYGVLQSPFLGFFPGMKAFIAAVLGGIGSLEGAVIGAFIMGISEVYANSIDSNLGFAAAFMILIIILLFRPSGIMGKKEIEKV